MTKQGVGGMERVQVGRIKITSTKNKGRTTNMLGRMEREEVGVAKMVIGGMERGMAAVGWITGTGRYDETTEEMKWWRGGSSIILTGRI